jgi:hypothetical protein
MYSCGTVSYRCNAGGFSAREKARRKRLCCPRPLSAEDEVKKADRQGQPPGRPGVSKLSPTSAVGSGWSTSKGVLRGEAPLRS